MDTHLYCVYLYIMGKKTKKPVKRNPRAGKGASKNVSTIMTVEKPVRHDLLKQHGRGTRTASEIDVMGKGGREAAFVDPERLLQVFKDYVQWSDENPILEHDIKVEDKTLVDVHKEHRRPWTLHGFCMYIGLHTGWWKDFKQSKTFKEKQFYSVFAAIENACYWQKFDGAAVGTYNATIIARDLGLRDETNMTLNDQREQTGGLFPFAPPGEEDDGKKKKHTKE